MIGRWTVLNVVLVAIVVLLGVQITWTWMRAVPPLRVPVAMDPADPAPRREPKSKPQTAHGENGAEQVALITSMDLFDVSRQAVGAAGVDVAVVEVPPPTGIDLVGIRLLAGDPEAFIRDASQQNGQRRVREGDEVAGYTVQAIKPTSLELGNPAGQTVTLWLQLAPSGARAGVPQAGGRPGVPQAGARPGGAPSAPPVRPAAAGPQGVVPAPVIDPRAAERQRQRQQRLQRQRGGAAAQPNVPAGVRQLRNEIRNGA